MLFRFECKKLLENKWLLWALLFVFLLNAVGVFVYISDFDQADESAVSTSMQSYEQMIEKTLLRANQNIEEYTYQGIPQDSYTIKYQKAVIQRYSDLETRVVVTEDTNTTGWSVLFTYTAADVLCIVMVMLVTIIVFVQDGKSVFSAVLRSTKRGRNPTFFSKLLLIICTSICIVAVLWGEVAVIVHYIYDISNITEAIQSVSLFMYCPYAMTLGEGFVWILLCKFIVLLFIAMFMMGIGILSYSYSVVLAMGMTYIGCSYVCQNADLHMLQILNAISIMNGNSIFLRYDAVNIGNRVIENVYVLLCMYSIGILMLIIYAFFHTGRCTLQGISIDTVLSRRLRCFGTRYLTKKDSHSKFNIMSQKKNYVATVFCVETYKLLCSNYGLLVLLVMLSVQFVYFHIQYEISDVTGDMLYKEYMLVLSGECTEEKENFISEERIRIDGILGQKDSMEEKYVNGKITRTDYSDYLSSYYDTQKRSTIFERIEEQLAEIQHHRENGETATTEPWFLYDTGWKKLTYGKTDFVMGIGLILLFSGMFAKEYQSGNFSQILRTTRNGRKYTFVQKYKLTCFITAVYVIFSAVMEIYMVFHIYDMPLSQAPIQSLDTYRALSYASTIGTYVLMQYVIRLFYAEMLSVMVVSLSALTRKQLYCIVLLTAALTLPYVWQDTWGQAFRSVAFLQYMSGSIYQLDVFFISTSCFLLCGILLWWRAHKAWCGFRKE